MFCLHFLQLFIAGEETQMLDWLQHYFLKFGDHVLERHSRILEVLQLHAAYLNVCEHC